MSHSEWIAHFLIFNFLFCDINITWYIALCWEEPLSSCVYTLYLQLAICKHMHMFAFCNVKDGDCACQPKILNALLLITHTNCIELAKCAWF